MVQAVLSLVTIAEYLELEEASTEKHELFRGRVYAMAGGSSNHGNIIDSLAGACRDALREQKPCRFVGESRKVLVQSSSSGYYPDGTIACPPNDLNPRHGTYDNPTVVFEVLSSSTASFDRGEKFDDYKMLDSLQDYVLIESEKPRVEVFSRLPDGRWAQSVYVKGSSISIPSVGIELSLDELYENAVFESAPSPPVTESATP
ncbi:Uma2 family endonuclease [bacterium]|nr:MAG: Uma2 family endonuclease [bacterium]